MNPEKNIKNTDSKNVSSSITEVKFESLPIELGLSNTIITCILQDQDGFMWISSNPGLIKYDGINFRKYEFDRSPAIRCGLKDKDGTLWFGSDNGHLLKYNREYDRFTAIYLNEDDNVPHSGSVFVILEDQNENLLIGTGGGLRIFNKKLQTFQIYDNRNSSLPYCYVLSLYIDRNGLIYIGTYKKELFTLDRSNNEIVNYSHSTGDSSLKGKTIFCIYEDKKNNLWIGTEKALNLYDRNKNKFINFINEKENPKSIPHDDIKFICEDKNNELWIATQGGGLNRYDNDGNFTNYRYDKNNSSSLVGDFLYTLFIDNSNVLWIGSLKGICKSDLERKKFFTVSGFFENSGFSETNDVSSIYMDSSGLFWIATKLNKGIFNFTKGNDGHLIFKDYSVITTTHSLEIFSCFEDKNHNIWFCHLGGVLFMYDSKSKVCSCFPISAGSIFWRMYRLNDDQILIATMEGYQTFDMNKKEYSDLSLNSETQQIFPDEFAMEYSFLDKQKNLWILYEYGRMFKYEIEKDTFTTYKNTLNDINSLQGLLDFVGGEDNKEKKLFVVSNSGLNILDKSTGKVAFYPVKIDGKLIEDESGNLWSGSKSENGLCKFNPQTNQYRAFDVTDGLQGNRFNFGAQFKDKDGTLYFGGPNGLTYFNPSEIKDNPYIPNIVLTDFQILYESVTPSPESPFLKENITIAKDITLSYKENVFSFEFAALIFNNAPKNKYAYMLDGFDKEWIYCGNRKNVTYTNLDPGEYTFRVKGSNNDGIWNEEGTSIKVKITPPWWQTLLFKSCGAAMIFLTAGYGYKKRVNKLKKEKKAQEEFSKKLINSQEEERKKIASVLHDSIAHDVLITKNSSEIGLRSDADKEEMKEIFGKISEQSSSTLNELRRIQFTLHPYEVEKLGLTKAIKSIVDRVSKSTDIKFSFDEAFIDKTFSEENEIHLYRIVQEAINNIIKHSSATEAGIKINRTDEKVFITISDNGKGFSKGIASKKNSMGLSGMSERVKLLVGNLEIEADKGTVLRISLPVSDLPL